MAFISYRAFSIRTPDGEQHPKVDAAVIRKTLRNFLEDEPAIKLVGEARNFAEAISMTCGFEAGRDSFGSSHAR